MSLCTDYVLLTFRIAVRCTTLFPPGQFEIFVRDPKSCRQNISKNCLPMYFRNGVFDTTLFSSELKLKVMFGSIIRILTSNLKYIFRTGNLFPTNVVHKIRSAKICAFKNSFAFTILDQCTVFGQSLFFDRPKQP